MTLQQILGYAFVVVILGGGALWVTGYLKVGEGGVELNQDKLHADTDVGPYAKAETFFTAQQYGDALNEYKKVLIQEPDHKDTPHIRYRIARCLHQTGKDAEAKAAYKQFIKQYPKHEDVPKARRYLATLGG